LPAVATFVGHVTSALLSFMNGFIERISSFPYAVYDGIQNNLTQTILLYICFISFCFWFLNKSKYTLFAALASAFVFIAIDCYEHYFIRQQQKIIVYSIPQHQAIDFISAKDYSFVGDSTLAKDGYLKNFHLKPSRTLHRISASNNLSELYISKPFVSFNGKKILLIDKPFRFQSDTKIKLDLIVISHNPRINLSSLANVFDCNQYVFDGSNSTWRIKQWKKDCDSLHLPHYSTSDSGAFQMEL
jgi:competence protein ComEC